MNICKIKLIVICLILCIFSTPVFAQEYHFASYNVRLDEKDNSGWSKRVDSLCNFILFNNFDVFGTQEVYYKQLIDMNKRLGNVYSNVGLSRDGKNDEGLFCNIFYKKDKFRVVSNGTIWLSTTPDKVSIGWDAPKPCICTWTCLNDVEKNTKIWFFNTHLYFKSNATMLTACNLILEKIKKICPNGANIVLSGDFNLTNESAVLNVFKKSNILVDSYDIAKYKWVPTGTNPDNFVINKITYYRIDFLWVSKNASVSRYGIHNNFYFLSKDKGICDLNQIDRSLVKIDGSYVPRNLSDHYPISIWTKFLN